MAIKAVIFDRDGVLTYFATAESLAFFQPLLPLSLEEIGAMAPVWEKSWLSTQFDRGETVLSYILA